MIQGVNERLKVPKRKNKFNETDGAQTFRKDFIVEEKAVEDLHRQINKRKNSHNN